MILSQDDKNIDLQKKIVMDTVIEKLMDWYKEVIDEALAEQIEATTEEQRSMLRERFLASFKSNLEVGLPTVFGNITEVTPQPLTEVGVEDLIRKGRYCLDIKQSLTCYLPCLCT